MTTLVTTFSDIFKKSFLEGWSNQSINTSTVIFSLIFTTLLALYIFIVYRISTRKTFYSKNFNISLVGVSLITSAIIITIQSNIIISLGMVGALSIVRFRTAIKNPMDLMFLFWAVSIGIICGAGHTIYAVILSIILTISIVALNFIPILKAPMILVINSSNLDIEPNIMAIVKKYSRYAEIKARNMTPSNISLTIEVNVSDGSLVKELQSLEGVTAVTLITHNGETTL